MALYFLDSSALLKLYFQEAGSPAMSRVANLPGTRLALSTLGVIEFRAAVRARQRRNEVAASVAEAALEHFQAKASSEWQRQILSDAVFDVAATLIDRQPLRAGDALQLASCIVFRLQLQSVAPVFTCSDHALLRAARAEGIPSWDPATDPAPGLH
ncbi:MAG: type II toxin-antitoxin system VapC family toxin [Terriglobales bacterium]